MPPPGEFFHSFKRIRGMSSRRVVSRDQEGVFYPTPCRKKRGEAFSKLRFPWKRGDKCKNFKRWPRANAGQAGKPDVQCLAAPLNKY